MPIASNQHSTHAVLILYCCRKRVKWIWCERWYQLQCFIYQLPVVYTTPYTHHVAIYCAPSPPSGTPTKINGRRKRFLVDGKKNFLTSANTLPLPFPSKSHVGDGVEGTAIARWDMSVIWWSITCRLLIFLPLKIRCATFHLDSRKPAICFVEGIILCDIRSGKYFYSKGTSVSKLLSWIY